MLRQVVLACFIATTASGPARATSLDDCSQNRSQEVRLRACSEIIAGQKALAFRNRCNASPLSRGIATPQRFALSGPGIDTIVAYTNSLSVTKGGSAKDRTVVPIVDAEDVGDARRGLPTRRSLARAVTMYQRPTRPPLIGKRRVSKKSPIRRV